jgi:hypothetical protein
METFALAKLLASFLAGFIAAGTFFIARRLLSEAR